MKTISISLSDSTAFNLLSDLFSVFSISKAPENPQGGAECLPSFSIVTSRMLFKSLSYLSCLQQVTLTILIKPAQTHPILFLIRYWVVFRDNKTKGKSCS